MQVYRVLNSVSTSKSNSLGTVRTLVDSIKNSVSNSVSGSFATVKDALRYVLNDVRDTMSKLSPVLDFFATFNSSNLNIGDELEEGYGRISQQVMLDAIETVEIIKSNDSSQGLFARLLFPNADTGEMISLAVDKISDAHYRVSCLTEQGSEVFAELGDANSSLLDDTFRTYLNEDKLTTYKTKAKVKLEDMAQKVSDSYGLQTLVDSVLSTSINDSGEPLNLSDVTSMIGSMAQSTNPSIVEALSSLKAKPRLSDLDILNWVKGLVQGLANSSYDSEEYKWKFSENNGHVDVWSWTAFFDGITAVASAVGTAIMLGGTAILKIIGAVLAIGGSAVKSVIDVIKSKTNINSCANINVTAQSRTLQIPIYTNRFTPAYLASVTNFKGDDLRLFMDRLIQNGAMVVPMYGMRIYVWPDDISDIMEHGVSSDTYLNFQGFVDLTAQPTPIIDSHEYIYQGDYQWANVDFGGLTFTSQNLWSFDHRDYLLDASFNTQLDVNDVRMNSIDGTLNVNPWTGGVLHEIGTSGFDSIMLSGRDPIYDIAGSGIDEADENLLRRATKSLAILLVVSATAYARKNNISISPAIPTYEIDRSTPIALTSTPYTATDLGYMLGLGRFLYNISCEPTGWNQGTRPSYAHCTWELIVNCVIPTIQNRPSCLSVALLDYNLISQFPSCGVASLDASDTPFAVTPNYAKNTVAWAIATAAIIAVAITATLVITKVVVKKKLAFKMNAKYQHAQATFEALQNDPENLQLYKSWRKECRKYNRMAKMFGFQSMDIENGWLMGDTGVSSSVGEQVYSTAEVVDQVSTTAANIDEKASATNTRTISMSDTMAKQDDLDTVKSNVAHIQELITG